MQQILSLVTLMTKTIVNSQFAVEEKNCELFWWVQAPTDFIMAALLD